MESLKKIGKYFALLLGFAMYVMAFEPFGVAEFAFLFALPIFLAARFGGFSRRAWTVSTLLFSWVAWIAILVWLRHVYPPVGMVFLIGLSLILSIFLFVWLLAARRIAMLPHTTVGRRFFGVLFLSALWIFLEWLRSWIFTGFPWLLLAHSQWRKPAMIQSAELGGPYAVSFVLIFFNLAFASFVSQIWMRHKMRMQSRLGLGVPSQKFAPSIELYSAILLILGSFWMYVGDIAQLRNPQKGFRAGMVQPDFAGILRWNPELEAENFDTIKKLTLGLKKARVDVALWPESATPPRYPVVGNAQVRAWVENLCAQFGKPIIMGNGAYIEDTAGAHIYNAAFYVSPTRGLNENFYAKQKLVPFGEYLPSWCFFLKNTIVPVGRMARGDGPNLFDAQIAGKDYKVGAIICYEDVFPQIGRASAAAGADLLFVCTNDSWYGREGGAWQHAAHSAFQAVATRKPVLRASINGLSGVFDQYGRLCPTFTLQNENGAVFDGAGNAAEIVDLADEAGVPLSPDTLKRKAGGPMLDDAGSIYFRGAGYSDVVFFEKFDNYETFYVRHGDWIPALCGAFLILSLLMRKKCLTLLSEK